MKRLMVNCYWLLVLGSGVQGFKGSRFTVHGSWFMVYGLWFMDIVPRLTLQIFKVAPYPVYALV